jgi:hypothetical protein
VTLSALAAARAFADTAVLEGGVSVVNIVAVLIIGAVVLSLTLSLSVALISSLELDVRTKDTEEEGMLDDSAETDELIVVLSASVTEATIELVALVALEVVALLLVTAAIDVLVTREGKHQYNVSTVIF